MNNGNNPSSSPPPPPPRPLPPPASSFTINGKDDFYHIPDELLLLIFTKLNDARSLCICNIVSKRFSKVVLQTTSIFLKYPHREANSFTDQNENFRQKMFRYISKPFFRYLQKPPPPQFDGALFRAAVESLKSFQKVRNLRIELPLFQHNESIVKWHAEFGKASNLCVILFATSQNRLISEKTTFPETTLTNQLLQTRIALANQVFREATWRQHVLQHVVEDHSRSLETAEIVDSSQKGRLIVRGKQQLADLLDPEVKLPPSGYGKLWHVQVIRLPLSQREMHGVSVVAIRRTNDHEEEHDDVGVKQMMKEGLKGDEERLLWEVLSHVFENDAPSTSLNINGRR